MTASSADRRRRRRHWCRRGLLASVALVTLLGAGTAWAQGAPSPVQTFDPMAESPDQGATDTLGEDLPSGPIRLFPLPGMGGPEADPSADAPEAPREVRDGILAIDSLGAVSAEATGLLDPGNGGLSFDLWQGSERAVVGAALAALPVSAPSRARHALTRRLLLTVAPPPAADGAEADGAVNLLDLRLDRLLAMGATADVRALAEAVSPDARPGNAAEPLRRAVAESWLIDNRLEEACAIVADGLGRFDTAFWEKAATFCDLAQGRAEAANMRLAMLRERAVDDEVFLWAAEQLAGLRVLSLAGVSDPTPLTVAMMRATGRPYPAGTLVDPKPWLLRAVALGEKTDMETRLQTAESAFLAGAFSREELTVLYGGLSFSDGAFAKPLDKVVAEADARTNALLWQMAETQTVPAARAEVIAAALHAAEARQHGLLAAHLYAPLIETLPVTAEFMWFAAEAGRALYAAGRPQAGRAWFRLAADAAVTSSEAARAADLLWPLDRIAIETLSDRWPERRMAAWRRTLGAETGGDGEPSARRQARLDALVLSLFQATGDRVSAADWAPLFGALRSNDGRTPAAPAWHAVTDAADALRVGETVLLSLMILGDTPPTLVSDTGLYRAVESLRLVGLEEPARMIAVESAVAAGL